MKYQEIRVKWNFNEIELAVLFGVSVKNVRAWEAGIAGPDERVKALYQKLSGDEKQAFDVFMVACTTNYSSIQDIKLLRQMTGRFSTDNQTAGILEVVLATSNPQFKPEDLGFVVARYPRK